LVLEVTDQLRSRSNYLSVRKEGFNLFSIQGLLFLIRIDSSLLIPVLSALLDVVKGLNLAFDYLLGPLSDVIWMHDIALLFIVEVSQLRRGMLNIMQIGERV
jgi:hypothetical protein